MMYRVTCFDTLRNCHFRKTGRQIQHKVELLPKTYEYLQTLSK